MRIIFFILLSINVQSQTININGSGTTVKVNGTGTTIGIADGYGQPQTGDITFTDADFNNSIPGYAGTNFTARSTAGYVEFKTTETVLDIKVGGNWSTASSGVDAQSDCEILVNGVYNQSVRLTADDVTQSIEVTLPEGNKVVRLINGYTANALSLTLQDAGVYIQGVETTGTIRVKTPVTPTHKWLFVGNSIITGASSTHPAVTGVAGLFRAGGRIVQSDSWGGRRLLTTSEALGNTMAAHLSSQLDATVSNELFIFLGTNNFGLSGGHSKADFKLYYGYLLDAFRAIRTDVTVYCVSPLDRTSYSTANGAGATLEDYSDAIQELLVDRTWAKFIYGKDLVTLSNMPDGLHPNDTGHQEFYDNLLIEYNALQ